MEPRQAELFDFEKLISIIFKKKWLIIFLVILILIPVYIYNETEVPRYRATTVIVFEDPQRPVSSINPFRSTLTKSFITNQIQEIKSRALAEEVVKALPPGIINTFPLPRKQEKHFAKDSYIASLVQKGTSAIAIPNSEVIKIQVEAYSAISAKVIANTVAEVFQKRNLEIRKEETINVREIIVEQLETFKNQLDSAEIALKQFKEESQVTVIEREAEEIFKRITEAEIIHNQTKANLDATKKRLAFIRKKLEQERKDLVPSITQITSPWAKKLKQQLVDLQGQYTKLQLQNYSDDHPKVKELISQIDQTKENLKTESYKIASGENIVDPINQIQKYMEESISLEIEVQTFQAQERTLRRVINEYKNNLNTIPNKELRLAQLSRDKEVNEKIYTMLLHKNEEAKIAEAEKMGDIRILDPARTPQSPYKPRKKLNLFLGTVFGFLIGLGIAFFTEALDKTVKTIEEVEQLSNLSVLGAIPEIKKAYSKSDVKIIREQKDKDTMEIVTRLKTLFSPDSMESDAFRNLRMNLQLMDIDAPLKSVLISSPNPNEGKSFVTTNLSIVSAQAGFKTLLIDADVKKPVLHKVFQKSRKPGLIDLISKVKSKMAETSTHSLLNKKHVHNKSKEKETPNSQEKGTDTVSKVLTSLDYIMLHKTNDIKTEIEKTISKTKIKNLDILTSGKDTVFSTEFIASKIMKNIFIELEDQYDIIFIDTPPIDITPIARVIGSIANATLLVTKANSTTKKDIFKAQRFLSDLQAKRVGLVLNQISESDKYSKYYSYYFNKNNGNNKE